MDTSRNRPVWLLISLASLFIILWGIRSLAPILNPILLALVITVTVLPVPGMLTRRGLPGWLALVLTILLVALVLGLVILTVFASVTRLATDLPEYLDDAADVATEAATSTAATQIIALSSPILQGGLNIFISLLTQFGMALLIFFFMISAAISLPQARRLGISMESEPVDKATSLTADVRNYMVILTGVNLLVAAGNTILLWILGVPYAVLWGILSWFMGYIPSIGFWFALIPPVLLAYAEQGLTTALIVFAGYVVINGGVQNFVQPKIMGDRLRISPVVVFTSLFVWSFLLGGIGAILAVPLTLLVLTVLDNFEVTRPVAELMRFTGAEGAPQQNVIVTSAKGFWGKAKGALNPSAVQPAEDIADVAAQGEREAHP